MGKYDDAIGGIDIGFNINEVIDEDSHKKAVNKLEETRKKAEEPIKIKIDSGEMDKLLKQEKEIVKTIKQLSHIKVNTKGISGLLNGNMSKAEIQKSIDALQNLYEIQNRIRQESGNTKRVGSDFLSGFSANDIKTDLLPKLQGQLSELNKLGLDNIAQLRERERLNNRLSKLSKKDFERATLKVVDGGDAEAEAKIIENIVANRKQVIEEMKTSGLFNKQEIKDIEQQNKGYLEKAKLLREIRVAKVKAGEKIVVQKEGEIPVEQPAKKPRGRKPKAETPAIDTPSSNMLFTDGTPLDDKEVKMVTKYLDIMKKKMGENYKEAEHLKTALDLVFDVKNRNIEKMMSRFTNGNDASNAVLNMATDMPINNQKNRDAALRSLNTEEYDRIIAERKSAMSKDKTEFQKKWEELASVMLGGDAFTDDSNLVKGKVAKAFEELGVTAKDGIEKINKMWLAGELEGKTFKNKYIQSYVDHLKDQKEYYSEMGKSQAGDIDIDGLFNGQADLKLTEEKAQALRNEAAAYDELIAKKKEYYGITSEKEKQNSAPQTHETKSGQMSLLPEVDAKNKLADANEKVAKSKKKVKEESQGEQVSFDDIIPKVTAETNAIEQSGKAAEKAAESKKKLADANKKVGTGAIETDDEGGKNIWTTSRSGESLDTLNLPVRYVGENGQDAVQMFAGLKSQIEAMTGKPVTIDFSSNVNEDGELEAVGATLKYVNEEAGVTVKQFYDIERNEEGILVATQSYEKATLSATKAAKNFNAEMQRKVAEAQIKTLETQMGELKLDLTDVKKAAAEINDQASLDKFNLELKAAKEEAKQLKAELKGQNALDTIASMERSALALPSELERIKRKLEELGNVDGAEAISDVLKSVEEEYNKFLTTDKSEDKTKAFRSLSTSMTWIKAEMNNLTDLNSKLQKQETQVAKEELAKQKAARESYSDWWKTTLNEQSKEESAAAARKKQEQAYSDWWNKALHEKEQKEKAKDERVIEARKKKEAAYEAWWQKQFKLQEIAEQKKADKPYLNYGKTTANAAERKRDQLQGTYDSLDVTNPKVATQMEEYKKKVQEVINLRNQFANDPNAAKDPALVKQFQKVSYEAEQARKGIKAILDDEANIKQMSEEQGFNTVNLLPEEMADYENRMIALAKEHKNGRVEIKGWNADHTKLNYTITDAKGTVQEMTIALGQGTNTMYQYRTATKETGTAFDRFMKGIRTKAKEISTFILGGGSIYKIIEIGRQGIQVVRDIDAALTELKKVTDETEETYEKFLDTASKTAAKVGSTIKDVISSTADWARLGYSMEQAAKFAESTQILMNVSEFTDVSRATDTLISSVQAFGYTAETSMEVVDLLNMIEFLSPYLKQYG